MRGDWRRSSTEVGRPDGVRCSSRRHGPRPTPRRRPPGSDRRGGSSARRIALIAALIALIPVAQSFIAMATEPTNTRLGVRAVEWLRDNGAAGIVAKVESVYYSLTAPAKGGPTLRALPKVGYAVGRRRVPLSAEYRPAARAPAAAPRASRARASGTQPAPASQRTRRCCSPRSAISPNTRGSWPDWPGSTPSARSSP